MTTPALDANGMLDSTIAPVFNCTSDGNAPLQLMTASAFGLHRMNKSHQ